MAGVQPAPPGPAQPAQVYYRDYFANVGNDVFGGNYVDVLAPYNIPAAVAPAHTPAQCRQLAFHAQGQGVPTAFLLQHDTDNRLHLYLQLDRTTPCMGMVATSWENRTFLGKEELHHNSHLMVKFDNDYWQRSNAFFSTDDAAIDNALTADPNAETVGLFTAADAGAAQYRTRSTCFVPPAYVGLFLAAPLTPRQAWTTVKAQIVADG